MDNYFAQLRFVIYARKSSTSEDRQVLSIDSQLNEMRELARKENYTIVGEFIDSASAHIVNNRVEFTKLLKKIESREIDGILTWKADRLARNPLEGGILIYSLQNNHLKIIRTPYSTYLPTDNMLPLTIEFGMANQYSLDLSKNVKRGNKAKVDNGGHCAKAPQGYLNDVLTKTVIPDPERFHLVRQMWDLYLTGNYSLTQICIIANDDWGYLTAKRKVNGGKPITVSILQKTFKNPFYFGLVRNGEQTNTGIHKPMITRLEYEKVQEIMSRQGRCGQTSYSFPLTGFIKCGHCDSSITAEAKIRYKCPHCNEKLTAKYPKPCRRCKKRITHEDIAKARHYTYYKCTKKNKTVFPTCPGNNLKDALLEKQFVEILEQLDIQPDFEKWALSWIKEINDKHFEEKEDQIDVLTKQLKIITKKQQSLIEMRADGEINKEEFLQKKKAYEIEIARLDTKRNNYRNQTNNWIDAVEKEFDFLKGIRKRFIEGSIKDKKFIFSKIGSNCILTDKKLTLDIQKPYLYLKHLKEAANVRIEPKHYRSHKDLNRDLSHEIFKWHSIVIAIRDYFLKNSYNFS